MTITITKWRLALVVAALALLAPATAVATHIFDDVADDRFFSEPVEWAAANDITTGVSPNLFAPDDEVTRGEAVTFLKRYNDNIVEPGLAGVEAGVGALSVDDLVGMFASDEITDDVDITSTSSVDLGLDATVTVPAGHTGVIVATFSAESACYGGDGSFDWCEVNILRDGLTPLGVPVFAFDSTDMGSETLESWEARSATRISEELPAGTYTVSVVARSEDGSSTFRLDDMVLTADVKLRS
ncbi:MAG: S-layer homology domain-containing protein [Acidimicrobiales bacterium]